MAIQSDERVTSSPWRSIAISPPTSGVHLPELTETFVNQVGGASSFLPIAGWFDTIVFRSPHSFQVGRRLGTASGLFAR